MTGYYSLVHSLETLAYIVCGLYKLCNIKVVLCPVTVIEYLVNPHHSEWMDPFGLQIWGHMYSLTFFCQQLWYSLPKSVRGFILHTGLHNCIWAPSFTIQEFLPFWNYLSSMTLYNCQSLLTHLFQVLALFKRFLPLSVPLQVVFSTFIISVV